MTKEKKEKKINAKNCREYMILINPFLKDSTSFEESAALLEHIDRCENCFDELRTTYMVHEGLKRLESGTGFNLNDDFKNMLSQSKKKYSNIKSLRHMVYTVASMAAIITFMMLIVGVFR